MKLLIFIVGLMSITANAATSVQYQCVKDCFGGVFDGTSILKVKPVSGIDLKVVRYDRIIEITSGVISDGPVSINVTRKVESFNGELHSYHIGSTTDVIGHELSDGGYLYKDTFVESCHLIRRPYLDLTVSGEAYEASCEDLKATIEFSGIFVKK